MSYVISVTYFMLLILLIYVVCTVPSTTVQLQLGIGTVQVLEATLVNRPV